MIKFRKIVLAIITVTLVIVAVHLIYLVSLSADEKYPEDTWLKMETNKVALIIVAHDDDMAGSAGTITMLCREGWSIREMCFYQQGGLYFKKDSAKNPVRKRSLARAGEIQGLAGIFPVDFNFRKDMDTEKSYLPMPYEQMDENYFTDSINGYIAMFIERYKPSVIFTLDPVIGGYGHPDHVFISRQVLRYCKEHRKDTGFSVKRIYCPVFPPSLAESVMGGLPVYRSARQVYNCNGMPLPQVEVDISGFASEKKEVLSSYTTEQNSIKKIWPWYSWYPSWIYFRIFNRDFYHVIETDRMADLPGTSLAE